MAGEYFLPTYHFLFIWNTPLSLLKISIAHSAVIILVSTQNLLARNPAPIELHSSHPHSFLYFCHSSWSSLSAESIRDRAFEYKRLLCAQWIDNENDHKFT